VSTYGEGSILIEELEQKLDSLDRAERKEALSSLCERAKTGEITFSEPIRAVNLHCHTFFSYNCYGYSPSKIAYLARKAGLAVAGIVDFDVLDGLDEFMEAGRMLGLKTCAGMETRVFVPEFADRVINSPGEPGISYHMGIGLVKSQLPAEQEKFLEGLRRTAQQRNTELMERVNDYLSPVRIDYEKDVLSLTPAGNATERHLCIAYARKAGELFGESTKLADFWSEKLDVDASGFEGPESMDLLNTIRAKTIKLGGAGYVQPDGGAFVKMEEMNKFVLAVGGIPTMTWLDGTSDGEKEIERLIEVGMETGAAAINIIPDRNYTPNDKDKKLVNLYRVVELTQKLHLVVVIGTEMNSAGQKFVDDFDSQELSPLLPTFLEGAYIVYAHSVLQRKASLGYMSSWAEDNFKSAADKNEFFHEVGRLLDVQCEDVLSDLDKNVRPRQIIKRLSN
jgi:hypothetical protein